MFGIRTSKYSIVPSIRLSQCGVPGRFHDITRTDSPGKTVLHAHFTRNDGIGVPHFG